jgi:Flp pilus assembly protein TadG
MTKPTKKHKFFHLENAQTMVEFALVFPFILLITYGLIEVGRMVFIYTTVTSSAREGARYGAAAGTVGGIPQYADCTGIETAVRKMALLTQINTISINYDNGPGIGPTYNCATVHANPSLIKLGYRVKVSVSTLFSPIIPFVGIKPFTISAYNARTILMHVQIEYP